MGKNNAILPNIEPYIKAGINPKTGLPIKLGDEDAMLKKNIRRVLREKDKTEFVRRYRWYNLPSGLTQDLLETMLYYRGQLAFFYMKADGKFYLLPYALQGLIDCYGRYLGITPVPYAGPAQDGKEKPWITGLTKKVYYDFPNDDELLEAFEDGCVLLFDRSKQLGQDVIPRSVMQEVLLDMESEAMPMARTSLLANSGVRGMRVESDDEVAEVKRASKAVTRAALDGDPWIPFVGHVEFQDITSGSALKAEEYLLYLQSLDNFRQSNLGIGDGSLFQKQSHLLQTEAIGNAQNPKSMYNDGLIMRQEFCDLVNAIWGLGIMCLPSEEMMMADMDGDGMIDSGVDQSGTEQGTQPDTDRGEDNAE